MTNQIKLISFGFVVVCLIWLLSLLPVASVAQDNLVPDGTPRQTYFAPFPVNITLDGDFSDWDGVPRVIAPEGANREAGQTSVLFAAAADSEYLYFMGDIVDTSIITGEHGTNYWNEDSVEFYVNGTGDLGLRSYIDGVAQVTIPALNMNLPPEEAIISGVQGTTVDAQVVTVETESGYAVELAIPLKNDVWEIIPAHGEAVGFQVHLNGASTTNRDTKIIWSVFDTSDQSYLNPSVFGQLIFFEIGQTEIPERVLAVPTPTAIPVSSSALYKSSRMPVEARLMDLMARMTLEEKVGQMTLIQNRVYAETGDIAALGIGGILSGGGGYPLGNNTPQGWAEMVNAFQAEAGRSRLGIPVIYGVDAVHGHNNLEGAVIFPHNIGLGATRNPELVERIGRATAEEMVATGIYWNYAPVVAVPQDIRWGRTYEAYSEDTEVVTDLSTAFLRGLQGEDLADPLTVLATPKHFVGDGAAAWGTSTTGTYMIDQGVSEIDEATLREVHLPPYIATIDSGAMSVMVSFSSWGGSKMHAQEYLITDVLKGELGFEGFVVSDWAGIDQISEDYYEAVVTAINAGIDMNMVPDDYNRFITTLTTAVRRGDVTIDRIDDAVRRILTVKFQMGLFENPYANSTMLDVVGSEEHRTLAREAVSQSAVLLKNDDNILPIAADTDVILVGGVAADDVGIQSGGWTLEWQGVTGDIVGGTSILEAIEAAVSANTQVLYDSTGEFTDGNPIMADVAIAVVGERPYAEGVGDDADLALLEEDLALLDALQNHSEQLVVILISGRPLIITDQIDNWDALVAAWLPGTEASGIADVLFGLRPFTGKLSFSWPRSVEQLPLGQDVGQTLFPLGYGLVTQSN